jgi:hypothetical protein
MWSLAEYRYAFMAVGLIGILVFSLPSLFTFVHLPAGEEFSELYVLGPRHMATDYPFNVSVGRAYLVYLGVGNHLSKAAYYEVLVKLDNSSDPLPNDTSVMASDLPVSYGYQVFLTDSQVWEEPLTFSFADVVFADNTSSVSTLRVNDAWVSVNKSAVWDNEGNGYFYWLIMELWLYNTASSSFGFNSRFVTLRMNITISE